MLFHHRVVRSWYRLLAKPITAKTILYCTLKSSWKKSSGKIEGPLTSHWFPVSIKATREMVASGKFRRADVVARGFSGYNTRQCRALLPYVASDLKEVAGATIFLGANDASEPVNTQQYVPLHEYVQNLKDIVAHFQKDGVDPIVITPPALDGDAWLRNCKESGRVYTKDEELTAKYAQACSNAAADMKVPCIDLHTAMINQEDWQSLLCDGLHLSRRGSELLASLLVPALEKQLIKHLPSEPLLPLWDEIDGENPSNSFLEWYNKNKLA